MQRVCFVLQVKPDRLDEYKERHRNVWPEMKAALRETGWGNYSLFLRDDGLLVGYLETEDFEGARAPLCGRSQAVWLRSNGGAGHAGPGHRVAAAARPDPLALVPGRAGWPCRGLLFPAIFVAGGVSLVILYRKLAGTGHLSLADMPTTPRREMTDGTPTTQARFGLVPWIVFNIILVASFAAVLIVSKYSVGETNQQTMEETHWANTFPPIAATAEVAAVAAGDPRRRDVGLSRRRAELGQHVLVALRRRRRGRARATPAVVAPGPAAGAAGVELHRRRVASLPLRRTRADDTLSRPGPLHAHRLRADGRARRDRGPATAAASGYAGWASARHGYLNGCTDRPRPARLAGGGLLAPRRDAALQIDDDVACPRVRPMVLVRNGPRQRVGFLRDRFEDGSLARQVELRLVVALFLQSADLFAASRPGREASTGQVSVARPLRCVLYRSPKEEQESPSPDPQALQRWLEKMQADYDLVAHDTYPFAAYDKSDRRQISDDYVEVFKFVPKGGSGTAAKPGQAMR